MLRAPTAILLGVMILDGGCYGGNTPAGGTGTSDVEMTTAATEDADTAPTSAGSTVPTSTTPAPSTGTDGGVACGDAVCDPNEDCGTCPGDCACALCGDGQCLAGEDCSICPGDCGACIPTCPNAACDNGEDCNSCPQDCGACPPTCPNAACDGGEDCSSCPQDCGACPPTCPNAACDGGEDCSSCPQDCGACPPTCPNAACDGGEDCSSCPQDCGACPPCPDGACDNGETCNSCPQDCGACPGFPPGGEADANCIGAEGGGGATCGGLPDAWTKAAVNLGYYPFRIKPGVNTSLLTCDNRAIEGLTEGQGFAAQSTRNPGCVDNPPLRPALNGYVFGYARGSGKSGWVPTDALEFAGYAGGSCADGPASEDYQVVHNPYDGCKPMTCDGQEGCAAVNGPNDGDNDCGGNGKNEARTVATDDVYLRYAPQSTAIRYLHNNDKVKVLYANAGGQWLFVEVTSTTCPVLTPNGSRGWVLNMPGYWK